MKTFRCGDVVVGCDVIFVGTGAEIESQVKEHAAAAHDLPELSNDTLDLVRAHLRPVS